MHGRGRKLAQSRRFGEQRRHACTQSKRLITRRSQVQILPPATAKGAGNGALRFLGAAIAGTILVSVAATGIRAYAVALAALAVIGLIGFGAAWLLLAKLERHES